MTTERMLYRRYKTAYADCETVPGSYDASTKSIAVLIPDGRKKPSRHTAASGFGTWNFTAWRRQQAAPSAARSKRRVWQTPLSACRTAAHGISHKRRAAAVH